MNNFGLGGSLVFGFPERSWKGLTGLGMYECLSPKVTVIQGQKFKVDITWDPRMGSIWIVFE